MPQAGQQAYHTSISNSQPTDSSSTWGVGGGGEGGGELKWRTPPATQTTTPTSFTPAAAGPSAALGPDDHAASQVADDDYVEYCVVRGRRSRVRGSVETDETVVLSEAPRSLPPAALSEQVVPLLPLRIRWNATTAAWHVLRADE